MGYDAYVRCNCRKQGKAKPLPADLKVEWDEEKDTFKVLNPECQSKSYNWDCQELYNRVFEWTMDACEHPNMQVAMVRVANMSGMVAFRWALESLGWEHFPTLQQELPIHNTGTTSAALAAQMLTELQFFWRQPEIGYGQQLVDAHTNEMIYDNLGGVNSFFAYLGGVRLGIDEAGYFVVVRFPEKSQDPLVKAALAGEEGLGEILFRSKRFAQQPTDDSSEAYPEPQYFLDTRPKGILLRDVETGEEFEAPSGVSLLKEMEDGTLRSLFPRRLYTRELLYTPDNFQWVVDSLTEVCNAAVETGNPIHWM